MDSIRIFPQWTEENKDYFIHPHQFEPFSVSWGDHPVYKDCFWSGYLKPGTVSNLFVLCRPEGYVWSGTAVIKPDLKIKRLIVEVPDGDKKYYGEIDCSIPFAKSKQDRQIEIDGHLYQQTGLKIFFPYGGPNNAAELELSEPLPIKVRFDTRSWTLVIEDAPGLKASVVGIGLEIHMEDLAYKHYLT